MSPQTNSNKDKHSGHHSHSSGEHSSHHSSSHHHHHHRSSSHHSSGSHHHHHHHHHSSKHHHSSGHSHQHHSSHGSGHSDYYYSDSPAASMNSEMAQEKIKNLSEKFDEMSVTSNQSHPSKRGSRSAPPPKEKKKSAVKIVIGVFVFLLLLVLVAVVTLFIMVNSGKKNLLDYEDTTVEAVEEAEIEDDGKTVRYNGKIYRLNENITSIACMGVDTKTINQNETVGTAGQADTLVVVAFDTDTGETSLISIPRDTIGEVDIYDTNGSFVRVEETQVCLAYAYGDGGKTSCENVVASLQKLMFGIPIRSYAALDLKGIGPINDAVGGVTVTPNESFGSFKAGKTVKLRGERAMEFVRYRDHKDVSGNLGRMERQTQYIKAFARTGVEKIGTDISAITKIYNTAMNYAYTNVSLSDVSYLAVEFVTKANGEFQTFSTPGEMVEGDDKYSEYYIDEKGFYETILSIYYNEIGTY